ncbi:MAG: FkbM family methyltransferase [Saprospiraceae bacterium]|nr:FkbM family methyltransferase [Saprospiraceae bacterium]
MPLKNLFKSARRKLLFYLSAGNNPIYIGYYKYIYKPKPGSLAHHLSLLSENIEDLFVVQVGANDGMTHDPIHKFIKRDQWRGVLLEPQVPVFRKYLARLYRDQEGVEVVNAALGTNDGEASLYCIGFSDARWATGLASFDRSVLEKAFSSGHVQRQVKKEGIEIPDNEAEKIVEVKVPVLTVDTLVEKFDIRKIDLLQVDTEGFDFEIIKLFDLHKIKPRAISYENMHLSPQDRTACEDYLNEHNYTIRHFGGNTLAVEPGLTGT